MGPRFFVLGDVVADQLYFVPHLPEHGGEVAATNFLVTPGGSASNVAVTLAKMGQSVTFAARAGTDILAEVALANIVHYAVDTSLLQIDREHPTSVVSVFITPDGERTMVSAAGASRHLDVSPLNPESIRNFHAIVFSAYCFIGEKQRKYADAVMFAATGYKIPIFIDIGTAAYHALGRQQLLDACHGATFLLMNEHELALLSGVSGITEGVAVLHAAGFDSLVIKQGALGSYISHKDSGRHVPPLEVENVVDTTGAGDAFTAGFAYGMLYGWTMPQAARLGNVLGALTTGAYGGQEAKIDRNLAITYAGLVSL